MGALFGGTKEQGVDAGANQYANEIARQARDQAAEATRNNQDLQAQLDKQRQADEEAQQKLLADQQAEVDQMEAARQAEEIAKQKQQAARQATGGISNFNNLSQGALAYQNKKNDSANQNLSNLQKLKNAQVYGSDQGFNSVQTGGNRYY